MVSVYLCICVSVYLCICVSVYLCICVSVYLCICVSVVLAIFKRNLQYNGFYVNGNYALFSMWWLYQFIPATSCMYCMTYMFLLTDRI
ncbi:hypothetical protein AGE13_22210 [Escherichia coli]|nr:hypothetical protein [Escherichia coli]